jgi:hypothetical protein
VGRGSTKPIVEQKSGCLSTRSGVPVPPAQKKAAARALRGVGPEDIALEGGGDLVYPRRDPERAVVWSSADGETKQFDRRE